MWRENGPIFATKVTRLMDGAFFSKGRAHQTRHVVLRHCGRKHYSVDAYARWRISLS